MNTSQLKILFINSIHYRKFGGGEQWMIKAVKGLQKAGHEVTLAGKKNSVLLKMANQAGIQTRVFNIYSDFSPINTYRIARFLRREKIQVLVCNLNKDVRVAGLAARIIGTPVVIARHGVLLCGKKQRHKIALMHLVDGILTNTQSIKASYERYGWFHSDFVKVIYNGIEDKSHVQAYDFSRQFPHEKVIFSAGRLTEQKGFSDLIKAAALLAKNRRDLVFIVAGKGRLEKQLKTLVQKWGVERLFYFWGFQKDIDPYLKGCDLFVLASLFEGMPNVVMEAMAVGKPVIATRVNGVEELVRDGETGLIVPSNTPELLAASISQIIDNPAMLRKFGENGLKRVKTSFTLTKMIENLEEYFFEKVRAKANP